MIDKQGAISKFAASFTFQDYAVDYTIDSCILQGLVVSFVVSMQARKTALPKEATAVIKSMMALVVRLFGLDEYDFGFCIPAQARGGYVGVVVRLQRPEGQARRPGLEQLRDIRRAVQTMVSGLVVNTTMSLPPSAVEQVAAPYVVIGQIVVHPLCDWQLMSLYQEIADTPDHLRRSAVS